MQLTLLAQIFTWGVVLLGVCLDYYWTDRKKQEFKRGRLVLLIAVVLGASLSIGASCHEQQQRNLRERDTLKQLLEHAEKELGYNLSVLKTKSGLTYGLLSGRVQGADRRRLMLEVIAAREFHASVPAVWGDDLSILARHSSNGAQAVDALVGFYQLLEEVRNKETALLQKIREEASADWRESYIRALHGRYETLRDVLTKTLKAAEPVLQEFGLARGVES